MMLLKEMVVPSRLLWSRTVVVWAFVIVVMVVLIWGFFLLPSSIDIMPKVSWGRHDLAGVDLFASLLWGTDAVLAQRGALRNAVRSTMRVLLAVTSVCFVAAGIVVLLVLQFPYVTQEGWTQQVGGLEGRLGLLVAVAGVVLCWMGLSRCMARVRQIIVGMRTDGLLPVPSRMPDHGEDYLTVLLPPFCLVVLLAIIASELSLIVGAHAI